MWLLEVLERINEEERAAIQSRWRAFLQAANQAQLNFSKS